MATNQFSLIHQPPPSYELSIKSPLLLAETTTRRTEVVTTTTTTETTTHFFSPSSWNKTASPPISTPNSLHSTVFLDKALPPTPSNADPLLPRSIKPQRSALPLTSSVSAGPSESRFRPQPMVRSASALAHAALGLGFPPATSNFPSQALHPEPLQLPAFPPAPILDPAPKLRKAKSTYRLKTRKSSEQGDRIAETPIAERRCRGISFTASTMLNIGTPDLKGKGEETQETLNQIHPSLKTLSRKSSFWSRKKSLESTEDTLLSETGVVSSKDGVVLSLPPLPFTTQISPFNLDHLMSPATQPTQPNDTINISRSHSENSVLGQSLAIPTPLPPVAFPRLSSSTFLTRNSNDLQPPSAPPIPRPRAQTNPPLLHRLSFGALPALKMAPPLPHFISSPISSTRLQIIPKPLVDEESPEIYLTRLKLAVGKAEIPGILASSSDAFYARALQTYINQFDFLDTPLDIALRKLLMEVGLPRETQQIDRVVEAFASRYIQHNSGLYVSQDQPYILAFSLIMLHTDAFNRSNKRKMTKSDYIKNTKLPGVPTEVLECFYDNILFAPFIFIEDPVDFNGQSGLTGTIHRSTTEQTPTSALPTANGLTTFKISNKLDPYFLITNNMLGSLRVDVEPYVPLNDPFTYEGTAGAWDEHFLHQAFMEASVIEVNTAPSAPRSCSNPDNTTTSSSSHKSDNVWNLKITKVGLLNVKTDTLEGGRKSNNRKWRTWTVILTGSQLLFFRDQAWATALSPAMDSAGDLVYSLPTTIFKPDELFSVKDAVAIYDKTYLKYKNTFRFVQNNGRQLLLQAVDGNDLNQWISRINYASSFKSAGVRMRPLGLSGDYIQLTGVAAATSHLHDIQISKPTWGSDAPGELISMLSESPSGKPALKRKLTINKGHTDVDLDVPVAPEVDGAEQFKITFDQVKADLEAGSWETSTQGSPQGVLEIDLPPVTAGGISLNSPTSRLPSRGNIIQTKIEELDSKITTLQSQLDTDMRFVRNIAILTPFKKATRAKLQTAVQDMAKKIAQLRIDLQKFTCHRMVLRKDLQSEGQMLQTSRKLALRAAKETLQSHVPRMTVSLHDDMGRGSSEFPDLFYTPSPGGPDSSVCGSFHSATESGFDWASSDDLGRPSSRQICDSPRPSVSPSACSSSFMYEPATNTKDAQESTITTVLREQSLSAQSTQGDSCSGDATQDDYEEVAEPWNQTRCAKRVSLIQVPPNLQVSSLLQPIAD